MKTVVVSKKGAMWRITASGESMSEINDLINAEHARIEKFLAATGDLSSRLDVSVEGLPQIQAPNFPAVSEMPAEFFSGPKRAETYRSIWNAVSMSRFPRIRTAPRHIEDARKCVESLLGVDLAQVRVDVIPTAEWNAENNAEGTTLKGGRERHLILVPEMCDCDPTELLVHEFGHAGHFSAQRANDNYAFFWTSPVTAEFVAHFCQYNYLLEQRPRADFYRALGQFVAATYALTIVDAHPRNGSFAEFIETPNASAFKQGWPRDALEKNFLAYRSNLGYLSEQLARGIAQILALVLVDEREGMRKFVKFDRIDESLLSKLQAAFPSGGLQERYQQIDSRLAGLLQRAPA